MKILSWNVNGIRSILKKGFLDWLSKEDPDILCLQETKASPDQLPPDLKEISGYRAYFSSPGKKGYSGVALYTKIEPRKIEYKFGKHKLDDEGRIILAHYKRFVIFNIYFPNGKASPERLKYKMKFYDIFLDCADELKKKGKNIIMCGDVNTAHKEIDLARPKENSKVSGFLPEERAWIDKLIDHGYTDTFRMFNQKPKQYTWWDLKSGARKRNVGWRIDYFFVSDNLKKKIKSAFIKSKVMGSDHCPIGIEL